LIGKRTRQRPYSWLPSEEAGPLHLYATGCSEVEKTLGELSRSRERPPVRSFSVSAVTANLEREFFEQAVQKAKEYISGRHFQVVLSSGSQRIPGP